MYNGVSMFSIMRHDNRNVEPGFKYRSGEPGISALASKLVGN